MTSPDVSVLTTCYNREAFIGDAIESVLSSTLDDFEYIIIDDHSSDNTAEIVHNYARRDTRIKVYVNEFTLGDYPNRNRAASVANGVYIKYVDSDDIIYPYGLQMMMDSMRAFPEAGFGLSRPSDYRRPYPFCLDPAQAYARHFFGVGLFSNGPLSAIIRRKCFEQVGGFSEKRHISDTELWLRLARRFSVVLMPMGLTWWRSHGDQEITEEITSRQAVAGRFELIRQALEHPECPLDKDLAASALCAAAIGHGQEVLAIARRGHVREAMAIANTSGLGVPTLFRGFVRSALRR